MRQGITRKPCEGCGTVQGRRIGSVCEDCRATLTNAAKAREEIAKRGEVMPYLVPARPSDLPYLMHQPTSGFDNVLKDGELQPRLHALMIAGSDPDASAEGGSRWNRGCESLPLEQNRSRHSISTVARLLRPEFALAFCEVVKHAGIALDHAYKEGVKKGSSLLQQLHAGDITTLEFERRTGRNDG